MFHSRISPPADLATLLAEVAVASRRPRYAFMVLSLIAQHARRDGSAGPLIRGEDGWIPIRDWLSDALGPMASRDPRRAALQHRVREDLAASGALPLDSQEQDELVAEKVREQIRAVGKCNLSRVASELVKAGLLKRHYQGYRVDHQNRGAQRQAVYTLCGAARALLNAPPPYEPEGPAQASLPFS